MSLRRSPRPPRAIGRPAECTCPIVATRRPRRPEKEGTARSRVAVRAARRGRRALDPDLADGLAPASDVRILRPSARGAARFHCAGSGRLDRRLHDRFMSWWWHCRCPARCLLTVAGGTLFGALLGGVAALIGATVGAVCIFLIAKSALGEHLVRRAGPRVASIAEGFRVDAFSYLLFLRLVPIFPFWLVNLVPALCGVSLKTFAARHGARHDPGHLRVHLRRRRPRECRGCAGSRLSGLHRGGKAGMQARLPSQERDHSRDPGRAGGARRPCARSGRRDAAADPLHQNVRMTAMHEGTPMAETLTPDICVIGAGSGGCRSPPAPPPSACRLCWSSRARWAATVSTPAACRRRRCWPPPSGRMRSRHARPFGLDTPRTEVDFAQVHRHVHDVIAEIAPNNSVARFTGLGVRVIKGTARFRDADTVTVGSEFEIKARRIVIATGSSPGRAADSGPRQHPLPDQRIGIRPDGTPRASGGHRCGADRPRTCAGISPARLAGHGPGSRSSRWRERIPNAPPSCSRHSRARTWTSVAASAWCGSRMRHPACASWCGTAAAARIRSRAAHLLVATGRRVNVDDLGLDRAGIAYDRKGIKVDRRLRTTNRRVYAVGDVAGGPQFTHVANYHAGNRAAERPVPPARHGQ